MKFEVVLKLVLASVLLFECSYETTTTMNYDFLNDVFISRENKDTSSEEVDTRIWPLRKNVWKRKNDPCKIGEALYCRTNTSAFSLLTPDFNDEGYLQKFRAHCKVARSCVHAFLKCGLPLMEPWKGRNWREYQAHCDATIFLNVEFRSCEEAMKSNSSTECSASPIETALNFDRYAEMTEDVKKETCDHFFGKQRCLEKQIVGACGIETFESLLKHVRVFNGVEFGDVIQSCNSS